MKSDQCHRAGPQLPHSLHVVAAVLEDAQGQVLLARRPDHAHQGGLWEFPGGKIEGDEPVYVALCRELNEELGIRVGAARPLIRVHYRYPDRLVLLDVWRVVAYEGEAHGREGQATAWIPRDKLREYALPAANRPIVTAARLPSVYLITPEPGDDHAQFLRSLEGMLRAGIRLVQLRAKKLAADGYARLARDVCALCRRWNAEPLLNAAPELVQSLGTCGLHLSSERLLSTVERPLGNDRWVAASCHNTAELRHAMKIGIDFVVLSPVRQTASHPEAATLGWDGFRALTELAAVPAFALGGMDCTDIATAYGSGGQGIAAISGLWDAPDAAQALAQCLETFAGATRTGTGTPSF